MDELASEDLETMEYFELYFQLRKECKCCQMFEDRMLYGPSGIPLSFGGNHWGTKFEEREWQKDKCPEPLFFLCFAEEV